MSRITGFPDVLFHHQNTTCCVSCGSIPLRRMSNTTLGAAALLPCIWHLAGGQEFIEVTWELIFEEKSHNVWDYHF